MNIEWAHLARRSIDLLVCMDCGRILEQVYDADRARDGGREKVDAARGHACTEGARTSGTPNTEGGG